MILRVNWIAIAVFIALLLHTIAFGAPVVTGSEGTLSHNATYTISGSGFGSKSPAPPAFYSDFESGSDGQPIYNGTPGNIGTHVVTLSSAVGEPSRPSFEADVLLTNSNMSGCSNFPFADTGVPEIGSKLGAQFGPSDSFYAEAYAYLEDPCEKLGDQIKIVRGWAIGSSMPNYTGTMTCNGGPHYKIETRCDFDNSSYLAARPPNYTWFKVQFGLIRSSAPEVADGYAYFQMDNDGHAAETVVTHSSCFTAQPGEVRFGDFNTIRGDPYNRCPPEPAPCNQRVFWDHMYIDNTMARVHLGNASTWVNSDVREVQIPQTWADGTITFTVNTGTFASGEYVYVFVHDADDNVNAAGHMVRVGSVAEVVPLTDPTDLTIFGGN